MLLLNICVEVVVIDKCRPVSRPGLQLALDKIEPVLAPEQLAIDDVTGRAKHAGINRLLRVGFVARLVLQYIDSP
jgi:hypothetical protein